MLSHPEASFFHNCDPSKTAARRREEAGALRSFAEKFS
jgi:hypothetical protein